MTIAQANKLEWGTMLQPSGYQRTQFPKREARDAIYLGLSSDGNSIKIVVEGNKTAESWSPTFWSVKPDVVND